MHLPTFHVKSHILYILLVSPWSYKCFVSLFIHSLLHSPPLTLPVKQRLQSKSFCELCLLNCILSLLNILKEQLTSNGIWGFWSLAIQFISLMLNQKFHIAVVVENSDPLTQLSSDTLASRLLFLLLDTHSTSLKGVGAHHLVSVLIYD